MNYKYKKDYFLRNKISGAVVRIFVDTNKIDENIWEIWNPKEGDFCWFFNKKEGSFPKLGKFLEHNVEKTYGCEFKGAFDISHSYIGWFDSCEPFIGELPSMLKSCS